MTLIPHGGTTLSRVSKFNVSVPSKRLASHGAGYCGKQRPKCSLKKDSWSVRAGQKIEPSYQEAGMSFGIGDFSFLAPFG